MFDRSKIKEALYQENGNCAAVARRFNTHRQSIHQILKEEGVDLKSFRDEIEKKKVAEAYKAGATTTKEIVAQTKLGKSRVRRAIKLLNIELPRNGLRQGEVYTNWQIIEVDFNAKSVTAKCLLCEKTYIVLKQSIVGNLSRCCKSCALMKNRQAIPIINVTSGQRYKSIAEAAVAAGVNYRTFSNKLRQKIPILGCVYRENT